MDLIASPPVPVVIQQQANSDDHLIQLWLHGRPATTKRAYRADIERFLKFLQKPLANITLGDLQGYADSLSILAPASQHRILSAFKSLLAFGHRLGYLQYDVGRALRLPAIRNRLAERILSEAEVLLMIERETHPRNHAILLTLYASGIRVSELCGLSWRDLLSYGDGTGQITVFGKGGKTRAVQLPESVWKRLLALRPHDWQLEDPVFRSRESKHGGRLDPATFLRIVRTAAKRVGIKGNVSPHWMRHSHASHGLDAGAPLSLIKATLGHASIATTDKYLHAKPKESSSWSGPQN